ncbi:MAG: T9SS type A sorting domain-containing protein [Bacteroidia bacterium]|nr:T9SS type A sorting domain-containing protein [Bacteroidia bacterium]
MKQLLLTLVLMTSLLHAQSWTMFTRNDTFHYRRDGDQILSATFFATGYSVSNGDTSFTFNVIGQDSGLTLASGPFSCTSCYGLINQPQAICGYSMLKSAGGICQMNSGNSVTEIHTLGSIGYSWTFNASATITAQVVAEYSGLVLGQPDSLRLALLSTGDSLIWSKLHGIVQWPEGNGLYYRLAGIQNRNLGEKLPGWKDYFDFQPGDMFEYASEFIETITEYEYHRSKITITSRTQSGDTLIYGYTGSHMAMYYDYWNNPPGNATSYWFSPVAGTFNVVDSASHATNSYHHRMVGRSAAYYPTVDMSPVYTQYVTDSLWYETCLFVDSLGNTGMLIGGDDPVDSSSVYFYGTQGSKRLYSNSDTTYMVYNGVTWYPSYIHTGSAYTEGLGMVRASFRSPGYLDGFIYSEKLIAYRKGNDTVGVFTPDDILLGMIPDISLPEISFYPNPTSDYLHISAEAAVVNSVLIYDGSGRIVLQQTNQGVRCVVPMHGLNDGIYYAEIFTDKGSVRKKLVVVR